MNHKLLIVFTVSILFFMSCSDGSLTNDGNLIGGDVDVRGASVAAGGRHSLILRQDGSVWAAGDNEHGQLGTGDNENRYSFTKIVSSGVSKIGATYLCSFILKKDGSLWSTGYNASGTLGTGDFENRSSFTKVIPSGVVDFSVNCRGSHCVVLKSDGSVWATGDNNNGQLATGSVDDINSFTKIINNGVVAIAAGNQTTFIRKNDGSIWGCGINYRGALGIGHNKNFYETDLLEICEPNSDIAHLFAGGSTFLIKKDGTIWATGDNEDGELGIGSYKNVNVFTQCSDSDELIASGVENAACGHQHNFIIKRGGELWGTGNRANGRLGKLISSSKSKFSQIEDNDGELITNVKSVSAGVTHSILLKDNGDVYVTGSNSYGQLGVGSNVSIDTFTSLSSFELGTITISNSSGNTISTFVIKTGLGTIQSEENIDNKKSVSFYNIPVGTYSIHASSHRGGFDLPYLWKETIEVTKDNVTLVSIGENGWF